MRVPNIEIREVICEERILEYKLTRKIVKNVNLIIKKDGQIMVSANKSVPIEYIDDFIKIKQKSIIKILDKYEENKKQMPSQKKNIQKMKYLIYLVKYVEKFTLNLKSIKLIIQL